MLGSLRFAVVAAFSVLVSACASTPAYLDYPPEPPTLPHVKSARVEEPDRPLQCVPFARVESGINIFGDAGTWWDQAAGRYERGSEPKIGSVMVLTGYAGPNRGHVAVVRAIDSSRQIRVDHANWLDDGAIYRGDPVVDVSPNNDWTEVRVWNIRANALGARTYPVRGFIGPGREGIDNRVASQSNPAENPGS